MFIETQNTPNPATLMFRPGREVMGSAQPVDFPDVASADKSPLATRLFGLEGVSGVFFGEDFLTVTVSGVEWDHIKPSILGGIMEHFTSGEPLLQEGASTEQAEKSGEDETEVVHLIKELLDTRVRPAVAQDGGDITFSSFDEPSGTVFLRMQGACAGCPSSTMTLQHGVENLLRHYIPEVQRVEPI
jgi:Fe-S cluster biogenesis protein NfuA